MKPTPHWLDRSLYPFATRFIQLKTGTMHYVDEGSGEVLLFVHGTWSFLYRDFIRHLSRTHRCIAIAHLGFGLSERSTDFNGTPEAHAANLVEFMTRLG